MARKSSASLPALLAVFFLVFASSASTSQAATTDELNAEWDDFMATLTDLKTACQPLAPTPPASPAASRAASPAASRSATPAASRGASPAASRSATPAASRSATPAASRAASPSASPAGTRAATPSASPAAASPSASGGPFTAASPSSSPVAPSPGSVPAITVGPGQTYTEPADAIPNLPAGFNMILLAGTYLKPFDIPADRGDWTIKGAGGGKTIIDGQGGAGSGHRLAWGKGCIHAQSAGTVSGVVFQNCGGADLKADGEAGIYAELFPSPGVLKIDKCLFLSNENGIFVPGTVSTGGPNITVVVTNSDFEGNGASKDGQSHDLYVQGAEYSETNCRHIGNPWGNNIKVRSPKLSVNGGYHANIQGSRWIDFPNGGTARINGGTFYIDQTSGGANMLSYAIENTNNGVNGGMQFTGGSKLYIGRAPSQVNVAPGGTISFDASTSVTWTNSGASVAVTGGGTLTGIPISPAKGGTIGTAPSQPPRVSGN